MKLVGCVFILVASICASFFYEKKLKKEISDEQDLLNFIKFIKNQIHYYSKPLDAIFNEYKSENNIIKSLILEKENTRLLSLNSSIQENMQVFATTIGKGFKNEQIRLCSETISLLESHINSLKSEYSKKTKAYRSVSLFIGICAVILLI